MSWHTDGFRVVVGHLDAFARGSPWEGLDAQISISVKDARLYISCDTAADIQIEEHGSALLIDDGEVIWTARSVNQLWVSLSGGDCAMDALGVGVPFSVYLPGTDAMVRTGSEDDYIENDGGNPTIYARNGDDEIVNITAATVYGQGGEDIIIGGDTGTEYLYGGAGEDLIDGNGGSTDYIEGGSGADTITLGEITSATGFSCAVGGVQLSAASRTVQRLASGLRPYQAPYAPPYAPMSLRLPSGSEIAESPALRSGLEAVRVKSSLVGSPSFEAATKPGAAETLPLVPVREPRAPA